MQSLPLENRASNKITRLILRFRTAGWVLCCACILAFICPSMPHEFLKLVRKVVQPLFNTQRQTRDISMAWMSNGATNADLVNKLQSNGLFSDNRIKEAMLATDRGDFCGTCRNPYGDHPEGIGYAATISAPHMHAQALQHLRDHLKPGSRVLDVGSGSGYLSVAMAHMVGETGKVTGIEHIEELTQTAKRNTRKNHKGLLDSGRVTFITGDGRQGYSQNAPYDAIHVGAAAPSIPPALIEQLAVGGRMLIPVGADGGNQEFMQVDKLEDGTTRNTKLLDVIYVPLTSRQHQLSRAN